MIWSKLALVRKRHVGYVASRTWLSADALAQIIHNHEMKTRPASTPRRSLSFSREDPVEHFNQIQHAHDDSRFFQQLARHSFLQRFSQLQRPSRYRPLASQRFAPSPDQQRSTILDYYSADTNHRTLRIFTGKCHFRNSAWRRFTIEAAAPPLRFELARRGI